MAQPDGFDVCLDGLYGSLCEPGRMPAALEAIRTFTQAGSCSLASFDDAGVVRGLVGAGMPSGLKESWIRHYSNLDPRRAHAMSAPPGKWVTDDRLLDPLHSPSREYANDFAVPMGMRWMRGGKVFEGATGSAILCIQRPANARTFDDTAVRKLDRLLAHVQRVCGLTLELGARLPVLSSATASLDLLDIPLCVVNGEARVLHSNRAGEHLLATSDSIRCRAGRIGAVRAATDSLLRDAIRKACNAFPRQASAFTLREPVFSGVCPAPPLWVRVLPLPLAHCVMSASDEPHALVLLEQGKKALDPVQLQALFGLSRAEAGLVVLLAAGNPAKTCARIRGVSLPTVRTQIASVLAKTGVASQPQLMVLLGSLTPLR